MHYYEGQLLRVKVGGTDTLTGGAFIYRDNILWRLNRELRKQLYGDDAFEYQNSKQRNAQLPLFVKLLLVSRWGEVKMFHNKEEVFVPPDGHAWSIVGRPALYEGSRVSVNGISEEGRSGPYAVDAAGNPRDYTEAEFRKVLQWTVAHELEHLLIRLPKGPDWDWRYHLNVPGSVSWGPKLRLEGIDGVRFDTLESKELDLRKRASVP